MSTDTKLLAAQAANKRLRDALRSIYMLPSYKEHHQIAAKALESIDDAAELDALIADAERYRWLRSQDTGPWQILDLVNDECNPPYLTLKFGFALDAAIDAMKEATP